VARCATCGCPDGQSCGADGSCGAASRPLFTELDGVVALEAEQYSANDGYVFKSDETIETPQGYQLSARGFSGTGYMATDGTGVRIDYDIHFTTTGSYYVNLRSIADISSRGGSEQNGFKMEFDGQAPAPAVNVAKRARWDWVTRLQFSEEPRLRGPVVIEVATPGKHTLSILIREEHSWFDKIVIRHKELCPENPEPYLGCLSGAGPSPERCADGTEEGQCADTPPLRCEGGALVARCGSCGCPDGQSCGADERCEVSVIQALGLASLTLIDARTDRPIAAHAPLSDGAVVDLEALGTDELSLRADPLPGTAIGSVDFFLDGVHQRYENGAPYALMGDLGGDYLPWTPAEGRHTVQAIPYADADASGTAGEPLSVTFEVVGP
jgi:hypothetical protein